MRKKLKITDLPESVRMEIQHAINQDDKMFALKIAKAEAIKSKSYVKAMEISRMIDFIEKEVTEKWLSKSQKEQVEMRTLLLNMPDDERHRMNVYVTGIIMLCDLIETYQMDAEAILNKYHPESRIVMYDKFKEVAKEAKEQVRYMGKVTELLYQEKFGDCADNLNTMVYNKVNSFIKKMERLRNERNKSE